jgi:hypothetical protein
LNSIADCDAIVGSIHHDTCDNDAPAYFNEKPRT